jgi:ABC-type dipeptide/oligopeptide/nickel transport system permease component
MTREELIQVLKTRWLERADALGLKRKSGKRESAFLEYLVGFVTAVGAFDVKLGESLHGLVLVASIRGESEILKDQ